MLYSLDLLLTKAECDVLLTQLTEDQKALGAKKNTGEIQETHFDKTSKEVKTELESLGREIPSLTTFISTLPEGKTKKDSQIDLENKVHRRNLLLFKKEDYNSVELIERQIDVNKLNVQADVVTDAIAKITAHKNTLTA